VSSIDRAYQIIQKPVVTEKASDDTLKRNAYTLRVPVDANKVEIRQAVERLFDVKVVSVNTISIRSKPRRRGYSIGFTPAWKKAMVSLAEGQSIDVL
jgi:large subunit ribosomal protein L23